jgi:hypothetical protein
MYTDNMDNNMNNKKNIMNKMLKQYFQEIIIILNKPKNVHLKEFIINFNENIGFIW